MLAQSNTQKQNTKNKNLQLKKVTLTVNSKNSQKNTRIKRNPRGTSL